MRHTHLTRATPILASLLLFLQIGLSSACAFEPGPEVLVVSPDGTRLYVANSVVNTVSVIDTATLRVAATVKLDGQDLLLGMAISPDGTRVYVNRSYSHGVVVIDTTASQVITTIPVGRIPEGVAVSPDSKQIYVANFGGTVSVIDAAANKVTTSITVEEAPIGVVMSPDGKRVYVANCHCASPSSQGGTVSVVDRPGNQVVATVTVGDGPRNLAVSHDGKRVYVPTGVGAGSSYPVAVIDTATDQVGESIKVPAGLHAFASAIAISPDDRRVYITNLNSNRLSVIDTTASPSVTSVSVGAFAWGVAASPDGARLYVIHKPSWTLDVLDAGTLQTVATVKLGPPPTGAN